MTGGDWKMQVSNSRRIKRIVMNREQLLNYLAVDILENLGINPTEKSIVQVEQLLRSLAPLTFAAKRNSSLELAIRI